MLKKHQPEFFVLLTCISCQYRKQRTFFLGLVVLVFKKF